MLNRLIHMLLLFFFFCSDLCDRVDKGIVSDHQKALSKMLNLNKQRMKGVIRGTAVSAIDTIFARSKFKKLFFVISLTTLFSILR